MHNNKIVMSIKQRIFNLILYLFAFHSRMKERKNEERKNY